MFVLSAAVMQFAYGVYIVLEACDWTLLACPGLVCEADDEMVGHIMTES
jgi:hypothetical protein